MAKVWFNIVIVLSISTSAFCGNIFNARTLPQLLTPARRLAPSDSELPSSSSSSSSAATSSFSSFSREETLSSEEDEVPEDEDSYPQYVFSYRVKDLSTGDEKQQEERRDGDSVKGQYSLMDSDGNLRVVEYNSDDTNGFQAIVSRKPSTDDDNQQTERKTEHLDLIATNIGPTLQFGKSQQSSAKVSQNEQRLTHPEAIALARRFPALVLGHRVPTTFINHAPTLFSPESETTVVTRKGEEKAIRNAGRTIVENVQHPRTIIEHRPATTFITQLTPGRTINFAHDIIN